MPRPMLAAKATDAELQKLFTKNPMFLISPKLDGVRALVVNGVVTSRTGKPIPNPYVQGLFSHLEGFDGELIVGPANHLNAMQATTSGVMSHSGQPDVTYHVFDVWNLSRPFSVRSPYFNQSPGARLNFLEHQVVQTYEEMLKLEEEFLSAGFEGAILRHPDRPYKNGRSTLAEAGMVKVKRFLDGEAVILAATPLEVNDNAPKLDELGFTKRSFAQSGKRAIETLGAFVVKDLGTDVVFSVGSGFTEAQRLDFWRNAESLIGKVIKYKSFTVGVKDKPRFPIFLGFRHKDDL